jgi:hypothetical protein
MSLISPKQEKVKHARKCVSPEFRYSVVPARQHRHSAALSDEK